MGGCPRRRINSIVDRCGLYKYVLDEYIKAIALHLSENLENQDNATNNKTTLKNYIKNYMNKK